MKTNGGLASTLKNRVYYAARDGMAITMYAVLQDRSRHDVQQLLSQVVEEDGQKCTPLIIAARNGHEKVVRTLLSNFKVDVEQEGTVKFDGYVIEGATALWCAAGAGHLGVVKHLVKHGADCNHPTHTNSTPLRAACFDGRLDIVKYLVEHKASIHLANKYNNTCLMIASYKGHLDVVDFLLSMGASPDERAHCGATALHFAAECGHLGVVRALVGSNAKVHATNENGMTPLVAAAERTRAEVVEFFMTRPEVLPSERVEALELLGASFANDKDNYSLELSYEYLRRGMELRLCYPEELHPKRNLLPPIAAYDNWVECGTVEDLESIRFNHNALHMESLAVRERVLGTRNPEVPHPVIFRGAVFADNAKFDRCIQLWMHALRLRQGNKVSVVKDLLRFAQVFSQMLHVGVEIPFEPVEQVLTAAIDELQRNNDRVTTKEGKEDPDLSTELESNLSTVLYLLVIVTKLVKVCPREVLHRLHCLVFRLVRLRAAAMDGQTLLHMAVNPDTPVDDFHTVDICKFPCAETTKLLVHCGADVNAMDRNRNTPLHIIVLYQKPISDFLTLHSIIMVLIEAGAHMDTVNANGATPFEAATTGVAEIILRTQSRINLKCMAAKAVKRYHLSYQGQVPKALEGFIELHGPGIKQG